MKTFENRKVNFQMKSALLVFLAMPIMSNAQSDLTAIIRGSEILVGGLITIFTSSKTNPNSTIVESVCIKNKMADKVTLIIKRQTDEGDEIKKELVIQKDSKECFYDLPKGIYSYEILLSNEEIYKKGEYRIKDKMAITLRDETKEEPKEVVKEDETKTPTD
jgi:hypothetical protein